MISDIDLGWTRSSEIEELQEKDRYRRDVGNNKEDKMGEERWLPKEI